MSNESAPASSIRWINPYAFEGDLITAPGRHDAYAKGWNDSIKPLFTSVTTSREDHVTRSRDTSKPLFSSSVPDKGNWPDVEMSAP